MMKILFLSFLVADLAMAGNWQPVASPSVGTGANSLSSVASAADNDIWATGWAYNSQLLAYRTVIEHWNGSKWSVVKSPNASTGYNLLNGVAVVASNDVWAVGNAAIGNNYSTLIEHWNGSAWNTVSSPNVPGSSNVLSGVSVIAANDIWAVGYSQNANFVFQPLALHWDGTAWSIVTTPGQSRLIAVDGTASNDVWATGETEPGEQSLTMHWDGNTWSVVPSPNDSTEDNILFGVAALASNDVWAVGSAGSLKTLAIHWDGTRWNLVPTPTFVYPKNNGVLVGIVALSSSDIWAAGQILQGSVEQTLSEHWDGSSWSMVSSPNVKNSNNRLAAITVTPNGTLWAVGTTGVFAKPEQTLILRKTP
ncbi:MAG TPA: hypothetical protein VGI60_03015 [Chthoniobacterales bacterium]